MKEEKRGREGKAKRGKGGKGARERQGDRARGRHAQRRRNLTLPLHPFRTEQEIPDGWLGGRGFRV